MTIPMNSLLAEVVQLVSFQKTKAWEEILRLHIKPKPLIGNEKNTFWGLVGLSAFIATAIWGLR